MSLTVMSTGGLSICGGTYAGQRLESPSGRQVRPMRSRVRGAVFDQLSDELQGERFLDCFAGTGAMGLEAISRGACFATFLDASAEALDCIQRNIQSVNETERTRVQQCDLFNSNVLEGSHETYRIISVTPPYRYFEEPDPRQRLFQLFDDLAGSMLEDGGQMIVECEDHTRFGCPPAGLKRMDRRTFGTTVIHRFGTK